MAEPTTHAAEASTPKLPRWRPNPGPQERFLRTTAFECLYGGAAGGGKSAGLVAAPLRYVDRGDFRALLLRRTLAELEGALLDKAARWYPLHCPQAKFNRAKHTWEFPSGAKIRFGYCETPGDETRYQGDEYQFLGFDELTHFGEAQYRYLLSRVRMGKGIAKMVRCTTNPGGKGHEWVRRRWAPWLDKARDVKAQAGEVLFVVADGDAERYVPRGAKGATSRVFIPARIADNPKLLAADPDYVARLRMLDPVTRRQLEEGDWDVQPARGLYFPRGSLRVVPVAPATVEARVRYWDRAASPEGDYTAGVRMARTPEGRFVVEDVVRLRGNPGAVEAAILATAALDPRGTVVGIEQDPGQAGVFEAQYYVAKLAGFDVRAVRPTGDKATRIGPFSAQAAGKNVDVVAGTWNGPYVAELEGFPDAEHDDQVDASSGAFALLTDQRPATFDDELAAAFAEIHRRD